MAYGETAAGAAATDEGRSHVSNTVAADTCVDPLATPIADTGRATLVASDSDSTLGAISISAEVGVVMSHERVFADERAGP